MENPLTKHLGYAVALFAAAFAIVLQHLAHPALETLTPYIFLFPVIVLVASHFGPGPGILAATSGLLVREVFFSEPASTQTQLWGVAVNLAALLLTSIYSGYLGIRSRKAQRRHTEELRGLLEAVPAAVWIAHDPECRTITGNRQASAAIAAASGENVSPSSAMPRPYRFFSPEGRELRNEELPMQRACATNREVRDVEFLVQIGEGERRAMYGHTVPLHDETGAVRGCIGAFMDVTDMKKSAEEARSSRQRYAAIHDHAPCAIALLKEPEGIITEANEAWEHLFECPRGEAIGRTIQQLELIDAEDAARIGKELHKKGVVRHAEVSLRTRSGKRRVGNVSCALVDIAGQSYQLSAAIDVTNRRQREDELQKSEAKFRWLYDSNLIGIVFWDTAGLLHDANAAFCRLIGVTQEQVQAGKVSWSELTPPELIARDQEAIEEIRRRGITEPYEKAFIHTDGHRVPVLIAGRLLDGSTTDGVAFVIDLSKQKSTEEALMKASAEMRQAREMAEQASQAKSLFLATMSHEIRTPLNAIMGFASLLAAEDLSTQEREDFAARIARNGQLLVHLIDDILDLSKIEAGKLQPEKIDMSLHEAIADVAAVMEHRAREKGIAFSMTTVEPLPETVRSDPTRFKQILSNIIGNAIKFTGQGEVRVSVQCDPALEILKATVRDTGIGLTSEQAGKLFQPFSQADLSTSRQYGGTGLGLVLARRLAQALGGDIRLVESRPGQGTTFEITIAMEGAKLEARPVPIAASRDGDPTRLDGIHVLLAEDVPDNQLLAKRLLTMAGASVEIANDGVEAVEKAQASPFDVILMDMRMPRLDGIQATAVLRSRGYQAPIVALTAHALREEVERSLAVGCNAHVAKPFRRDELIQVIRRSMGLPGEGAASHG